MICACQASASERMLMATAHSAKTSPIFDSLAGRRRVRSSHAIIRNLLVRPELTKLLGLETQARSACGAPPSTVAAQSAGHLCRGPRLGLGLTKQGGCVANGQARLVRCRELVCNRAHLCTTYLPSVLVRASRKKVWENSPSTSPAPR